MIKYIAGNILRVLTKIINETALTTEEITDSQAQTKGGRL